MAGCKPSHCQTWRDTGGYLAPSNRDLQLSGSGVTVSKQLPGYVLWKMTFKRSF